MKKKNAQTLIIVILGFVLIVGVVGVTYSFFNYNRTGPTNTLQTGTILFNYEDGTSMNIVNQYPMSESELTSSNMLTFSIQAHTTLSNGIDFNVYAVPGDTVSGKTRLLDETIKMKFVAPADGNGFTMTSNNYATAASPTFVGNQALIATGHIQNTSALTTKSYSLYMWLDSDLAYISSTTKRATLAEGNPSLADATTGTVTASRYMKNNNESSTVTLYPAKADATGKIIYTTNELANSYYSIKIRVEANDRVGS